MNKLIAPSRPSAFSRPDAVLGSLSASAAASLLAAVGDVSIVISADGLVLDIAVAQGELAPYGFSDWVGAPWIDTVSEDSRTKVVEMLADATRPGAEPRWRQVTHPAPGGDLPVRYLVTSLGESGNLIAIGRDMRAAAAMQQRLLRTQQSLERDYIRLRQAETRYRLLFDIASEAVLIVDGESRMIREANPAAHRLLGMDDGALIGAAIGSIVDPVNHDDFVAHLGAAEVMEDVMPIAVQLTDQRGEARLSARLFRESRRPLILVRILPPAGSSNVSRHQTSLNDVVERMPDAFVLVDRDLSVLTANAAFVDMAEMASADRVAGMKLATWLGRPGIDLDLIIGQLREHGAVRNVATILRGSAGAREEIEISGVVAPMGNSDCYGFTIRNVGRRLRDAPALQRDSPRSVEQLTELVGRMSLKDIVRESTDLIERLCIEAALSYTSDNRASAAEILGLSRQSLYSKLHRHGLGNLVSDDR